VRILGGGAWAAKSVATHARAVGDGVAALIVAGVVLRVVLASAS
jgi:hypothetical protein